MRTPLSKRDKIKLVIMAMLLVFSAFHVDKNSSNPKKKCYPKLSKREDPDSSVE